MFNLNMLLKWTIISVFMHICVYFLSKEIKKLNFRLYRKTIGHFIFHKCFLGIHILKLTLGTDNEYRQFVYKYTRNKVQFIIILTFVIE